MLDKSENIFMEILLMCMSAVNMSVSNNIMLSVILNSIPHPSQGNRV